MQLASEVVNALCAWAEAQPSVRELWLFGSRAKGAAKPDSDVDLAVGLAVPDERGDWAFGAFVSLADRWKAELADIVGRPISFGPLNDGRSDEPEASVMDEEVRSTGVLLWARPPSPA